MKGRRHTRGTVLLVVLLLASMMLVTVAVWIESSVVVTRNAASLRERAQAFHAADSALIRCSRIALDSSPAHDAVGTSSAWRLKASFEGPAARAIVPIAAWPHARRAPQCLIETWERDESTMYLVTARGFGTGPNAEAWLQLEMEEGETGVTRHWRRVVARPF
jgi:Tfp pilus assembly protein PilX